MEFIGVYIIVLLFHFFFFFYQFKEIKDKYVFALPDCSDNSSHHTGKTVTYVLPVRYLCTFKSLVKINERSLFSNKLDNFVRRLINCYLHDCSNTRLSADGVSLLKPSLINTSLNGLLLIVYKSSHVCFVKYRDSGF